MDRAYLIYKSEKYVVLTDTLPAPNYYAAYMEGQMMAAVRSVEPPFFYLITMSPNTNINKLVITIRTKKDPKPKYCYLPLDIYRPVNIDTGKENRPNVEDFPEEIIDIIANDDTQHLDEFYRDMLKKVKQKQAKDNKNGTAASAGDKNDEEATDETRIRASLVYESGAVFVLTDTLPSPNWYAVYNMGYMVMATPAVKPLSPNDIQIDPDVETNTCTLTIQTSSDPEPKHSYMPLDMFHDSVDIDTGFKNRPHYRDFPLTVRVALTSGGNYEELYRDFLKNAKEGKRKEEAAAKHKQEQEAATKNTKNEKASTAENKINEKAATANNGINETAATADNEINETAATADNEINETAATADNEINETTATADNEINETAATADNEINETAATADNEINETAATAYNEINETAATAYNEINERAATADNEIDEMAPER